jgi:hypothetical protein
LIQKGVYFSFFVCWNKGWNNMNGDECNVYGHFDVTLRLPPVPRRGIYEIRYKIIAIDNRSVTQVFFGTDKESLYPVGLPIDFTKTLSNPQFGWQRDSGNEYADQMVDNEFHYNKVMKGAKSIAPNNQIERDNQRNLRHILLTQAMEPDQTYYIRFKCAIDNYMKSLYLDYIEFCPKEVYDNPEKPEDVW